MLDPAVDRTADALLVHALLDALLHTGEKFLVGGGALGQLRFDLLVTHGVQIAQGQVLQLPLQLLHT